MQSDLNYCWKCGRFGTEKHHVIFGVSSNKKRAEKAGLMVGLCYEHHQGTNGVHGKNGKQINDDLRWHAQYAFEQHIGTRQDFINTFGKSYL